MVDVKRQVDSPRVDNLDGDGDEEEAVRETAQWLQTRVGQNRIDTA